MTEIAHFKQPRLFYKLGIISFSHDIKIITISDKKCILSLATSKKRKIKEKCYTRSRKNVLKLDFFSETDNINISFAVKFMHNCPVCDIFRQNPILCMHLQKQRRDPDFYAIGQLHYKSHSLQNVDSWTGISFAEMNLA